MWTYTQINGEMQRENQQFFGYSGHGPGLNNPAMADAKNIGPIPCGLYSIGPWHDEPHLGPCVARLTPVGHDADGRTDLMIHGDNRAANHSASDGCCIQGPNARFAMRASGDTSLNVVTGVPDESVSYTS
jgi:type VI secretion system (T6SS) effector TldE1-like protein